MKNNIFVIIDRICAWVLLVGMIIYFISGYGMTKGLISSNLAASLHLDYIGVIVLIAFTYHAGYATRLALVRWNKWNIAYKSIWFSFFAIFLIGFLFIDKIYSPKSENESNSQLSSENKNSELDITPIATSTLSPSNVSSDSIFTKAELANYDGKNGNNAYVAVDGNVYDMTKVFKEGTHFSHFAGTELTNAFYSYHAKDALSKYPIVGTLED